VLITCLYVIRSCLTKCYTVVVDEQAPLTFIRKHGGPQRELAHFKMHWDDSLHSQVGTSICDNSDDLGCPTIGFVRHLGHKFSPLVNPESVSSGLPITANSDIVGLSGGFGWFLDFDVPAPRSLRLEGFEIDPASPLIVSIPYPVGAAFEITANGPSWCGEFREFKCKLNFVSVASIDEVRTGRGDGYYVDPDGILTERLRWESRLFDSRLGNHNTMGHIENPFSLAA
jgi:hypothetical protein